MEQHACICSSKKLQTLPIVLFILIQLYRSLFYTVVFILSFAEGGMKTLHRITKVRKKNILWMRSKLIVLFSSFLRNQIANTKVNEIRMAERQKQTSWFHSKTRIMTYITFQLRVYVFRQIITTNSTARS